MATFSLLDGFKHAFKDIIPTGYRELITGQDLTIKFLFAEVCFCLRKKQLKYRTNPFFLWGGLGFTQNGCTWQYGSVFYC